MEVKYKLVIIYNHIPCRIVQNVRVLCVIRATKSPRYEGNSALCMSMQRLFSPTLRKMFGYLMSVCSHTADDLFPILFFFFVLFCFFVGGGGGGQHEAHS